MHPARIPLIKGYEAQRLAEAEFEPIFRENRARVFAGDLTLPPDAFYSAAEREARERLREGRGTPFSLHLGIYREDELAGWSFGWQESAERFYMVNTGLFEEHRGRGIYTALLPRILEIVGAAGFQVAYSRHTATNNQVIVPKLKAGFVITGMELSDTFGTLVHLSYFYNEGRRRALEFRAGGLPDARTRALIQGCGP